MTDASSDQVDIPALEKLLGYTFNNTDFLLTAVTHRSYLNENRQATQEHNERSEFLGDAVLELVVTDFLYRKYPKTGR